MESVHSAAFWVGILVAAVSLCWAVARSVIIVRGSELAVLERRWIGHRLQNGRVVALDGDVGIQAHVLSPGLHWVIPFIYTCTKPALARVGGNEVGLVEAIDGEPISAGHIFARVVEGHDSFQNGAAFLRSRGKRGPQLQVVPPGLYRINPTCSARHRQGRRRPDR